jgi:RNA polymerase sigma-70 factor (ECF subfamily)
VVQGAYLSAFRFFESRDIECEFNDDVCEDTTSENQTSEERSQLLRHQIENLPAAFREVIVLRELEGLSYKEIAAITES